MSVLDEDLDAEKVMTFREHLGELRGVLVRIALALVLGFFVGWSFRQEIFDFLSSPITDALADNGIYHYQAISIACLLYTSPSPRDLSTSRMPSSA